MFRQTRHLVRRDHADFWIIRKSLLQLVAHTWRGFAQQELARGGGDDIRMECFARAVIKYARLRSRHQCRDLLCDQSEMHVLVSCIDVNGMRTVPERQPVGDHARHNVVSGPSAPNTGSVLGGGTFGMKVSALACSALLPRERLYLLLGG